jgi:hypothetical protein
MPRVPPHTQIAPRRIHRNNQLNLPNPEPPFDPFLAVNRIAHIVETLVVNESIDLVPLAKFRSIPQLVFPNPSAEVIRNAGVERLGAVCENINAVAPLVARMRQGRHGLNCASYERENL